jgi:pyridoxal phosphate enzyme (YggS family)
MDELTRFIQERYQAVLGRIRAAEERSGRAAGSTRLVVVTKSQPVEIVRAAIEAGIRTLGENYPEEGATKIQSLADFSAVEWHMIGHVQSRKAALVAANFNYMHSLDSLKLAARLDRFSGEAGRRLPTLLEFNVGDEGSKSGWAAADEARWPQLVENVDAILKLPHLEVRGLMTMPPIDENPELSRPFFQKLTRLQKFLQGKFPGANFSELSMGTSTDFEVAVEEGATLVRVGTAIVGPRKYKTEVG